MDRGLSASDTRSVVLNSLNLASRLCVSPCEQMLANKLVSEIRIVTSQRRSVYSLSLTPPWPYYVAPLPTLLPPSSCLRSLLCQSRVKFPSVLVMFVSKAVLTKLPSSPGIGCLLSFLIHV